MNRTDRLYALVEELRAVSPRPRSAAWLAERFEVSRRTILRDLDALSQAGVPLWAQTGRGGGYALDRERTLPPLNVTAEEAIALAVGLERLTGTPFHGDARSALAKLVAVMPADARASARAMADRVHVRTPDAAARVPDVLRHALETGGRVLRIAYVDGGGARTTRLVEPLGMFGGGHGWYLFAWCRLRDGVRAFRMDRIESAEATGETAPPRPLDLAELGVPGVARLAERVDMLDKG